MPWYDVIWNYEPGGNVEYIAQHGITPEDVEAVICNPLETTQSRSSKRPAATGYTSDGRLILVYTKKSTKRPSIQSQLMTLTSEQPWDVKSEIA
jgi:hypothetical protein